MNLTKELLQDKLKALMVGLECEDIDFAIENLPPEGFKEIGKRIARVAKANVKVAEDFLRAQGKLDN